MKRTLRFGRRDAVQLGGVLLIVTLLSGTCFYFAGRHRVQWSEQTGIVIGKAVQLPPPPSKQMMPVHWILILRTSDGTVVEIEVSKETYDVTPLGAKVTRDRFGNVVVSGKKATHASVEIGSSRRDVVRKKTRRTAIVERI